MNTYQRLMKEIFPHLKLRDPNLSLAKRVYIYVSIFAQLWVIIWLLLYLGSPLFSTNRYHNKNISFYTYVPTKDTKREKEFFNHVESLIAKHPLYARHKEIAFYLLNNRFIYRLFNPVEFLPNRQTFAATYRQSIFFDHVSISNNKVYASNCVKDNLDAILLHESVHAMQNIRYGWFYTTFQMPYWVKEGYAIYSAWDLSHYKADKIVEYIKTTKDIAVNKWETFAMDQLYALMVKHAIEQMHYSVDDLHRGKVDYDTVYKDMMRHYKSK